MHVKLDRVKGAYFNTTINKHPKKENNSINHLILITVENWNEEGKRREKTIEQTKNNHLLNFSFISMMELITYSSPSQIIKNI